jgi:hypothetical protein
MADWQTVRYDPTYEEKLDEEIIPLCDALNAAGFVTTSSCTMHGQGWPYVFFEHSTDERIERLARFVKKGEIGDYRPYFTMWQKEILEDGYAWCLEIHLNNVYCDTAQAVVSRERSHALASVTEAVVDWGARELSI